MRVEKIIKINKNTRDFLANEEVRSTTREAIDKNKTISVTKNKQITIKDMAHRNFIFFCFESHHT